MWKKIKHECKNFLDLKIYYCWWWDPAQFSRMWNGCMWLAKGCTRGFLVAANELVS